MAQKKITIREVAASVGVNPSTVSRALNPETRSLITPQVVKKVEKAAQKLGYYPNKMAAALKKNKSLTVGVLIPDLVNPLFPPIIRGLQDTLDAAGYTVITASSDNNPDYEQTAFRKLRERAVDGFVMATAHLEDPLIDECIKDKLPLVLINRTVTKPGVSAVINDDRAGIRAAVEHLLELGHKKIAHIAGPQDTSTGLMRYTEFLSDMREHDLADNLVEIAKAFTVEEGRKACEKFLNTKNKFSAIIAGNDLIALGCIDALKEKGLTCPQDVSVIGFNNMPMLDRMTPALTSIAVPHYEFGVRAAEILLDKIQRPDRESVVVQLSPKLVVRDSTSQASQ